MPSLRPAPFEPSPRESAGRPTGSPLPRLPRGPGRSFARVAATLCAVPLFAFGPCRTTGAAAPAADGRSTGDAAETDGAAVAPVPDVLPAANPPGTPDAALLSPEAPAGTMGAPAPGTTDVAGTAGETPAEAAARLLRDAVVIDLHADVVFQVADRGRDFATGDGQWTIERARRGGEDAQFFPLWLPRSDPDRVASLKRHARALDEMLRAAGDELALVRTSRELRERAGRGALSVLLGLEGADGLGDDPRNLDPYAARGLRYLGLTWNDSNAFAEAAADRRDPPGLTDAGRALVARANDAGVLLDLAHASAATFWDVHRLSRSPLLVSHAGLRALHDHPRNIDDLQLLALARTGGVVGIVWHSGFLADLPEGRTRAPLDALLDHYDHARTLGAAAALALGSDLDGGIRPPEGLDTIAELPVLVAGLLERGWSEAEVRGVLGDNMLRLLDAADTAVDGPSPAREWPATAACDGLATDKDEQRLVDRLALPGPELAPGTELQLRWETPTAATTAVLEAWGEPGARLAVQPAPGGDPQPSDGSQENPDPGPGDLRIGPSGNGRLALAEAQAQARRLVVTVLPLAVRDVASDPDRPVRLDELAVWLH